MASILYKDGIPHRFEARRVPAALKQGYSATKEPVVEPVVDDELEGLKDQYQEAFGRKPHHKMTADTIRARLQEHDEHERLQD